MHSIRSGVTQRAVVSLRRRMPTGETKKVGPYYLRAVANIERLFNELSRPKEHGGQGLLQKELAFAIGHSETVFSSKLRGIRSHFYEDEMEAIAIFFRERTGRPLVGFPHLEWTVMELIDRKLFDWEP